MMMAMLVMMVRDCEELTSIYITYKQEMAYHLKAQLHGCYILEGSARWVVQHRINVGACFRGSADPSDTGYKRCFWDTGKRWPNMESQS